MEEHPSNVAVLSAPVDLPVKYADAYLIGLDGIGKSSLWKRFQQLPYRFLRLECQFLSVTSESFSNPFSPACAPLVPETPLTLIGVEFAVQMRRLKDYEVCVRLMDLGGGERLHLMMYPTWYTGNIVVLCYAIDSDESYAHLKSHYQQNKERLRPESFVVIVGLRSDLEDSRKVHRGDVELYAQEIRATAIEVSSKEGTDLEEFQDLLFSLAASEHLPERSPGPTPRTQRAGLCSLS